MLSAGVEPAGTWQAMVFYTAFTASLAGPSSAMSRRSDTRSLARTFIVLAILSMCLPARAVTVAGLYDATVAVEGRSESALGTAFAEALKQVLVRVSGSRAAGERAASALGSARRYVQRFGFETDGRLSVGFDPGSIDRLLADSGLPVWGRERPATLMLLSHADGAGGRLWVDASSVTAEIEAVENAARERGLPLVWPLLDLEEQVRLANLAAASDPAEQLADAASRYKVDAVLFGRMPADPASAEPVDWTFYFDGATSRSRADLAAGVDLAADTIAAVFAGSASVASDVLLDLQGITGLDAYGSAMNYLEGLTLVQAVEVEELAGDTLRLRLRLRGDANILERTLALDGRLIPQALSAQPGRLVYRYSP